MYAESANTLLRSRTLAVPSFGSCGAKTYGNWRDGVRVLLVGVRGGGLGSPRVGVEGGIAPGEMSYRMFVGGR